VQKKLMRHAQMCATMNIYGSAYMEEKREAHAKVVQMVLSGQKQKATGCLYLVMFARTRCSCLFGLRLALSQTWQEV
jgi:hypothetical protein